MSSWQVHGDDLMPRLEDFRERGTKEMFSGVEMPEMLCAGGRRRARLAGEWAIRQLFARFSPHFLLI